MIRSGLVECRTPLYLGLSFKGKPSGMMRVTDKVELSIHTSPLSDDETVWVSYDEGICENGANIQWDSFLMLTNWDCGRMEL